MAMLRGDLVTGRRERPDQCFKKHKHVYVHMQTVHNLLGSLVNEHEDSTGSLKGPAGPREVGRLAKQAVCETSGRESESRGPVPLELWVDVGSRLLPDLLTSRQF